MALLLLLLLVPRGNLAVLLLGFSEIWFEGTLFKFFKCLCFNRGTVLTFYGKFRIVK